MCASARSHGRHLDPALRRRDHSTTAQGSDGQSRDGCHSATVHRLTDCLSPPAVWKICHRRPSGNRHFITHVIDWG